MGCAPWDHEERSDAANALPHTHMPAGTVSRLLIDGSSIILIDLLLAGDNALVIAMAVRALPQRQRRLASTFGAAAAVALRVVLTVSAARLLGIEFIKLLGGAFILWLAVKVLADASSEPAVAPPRRQLLKAVWFIVVADITMSTDNILAVAGAARGDLSLIVFGLCVSIPFVVFSSNLIAMLMDRYPVILYLGAAILGKVGAEMMLTDPFVIKTLHPPAGFAYGIEGMAIFGILAAGRILSERTRNARTAE
jgi:YjbE family integral membrane protein